MDLSNYFTIKELIKEYDVAESTVRMAAKNNATSGRFSKIELIKLSRDWLILKNAAEREWGKKKRSKGE